MMTENDILGFDPSQLSVFATTEQKTKGGNPLIYRTRPIDSKDEDGIYRSTIKLIYSPQDMKHSFLELQTYAMQDTNGWFTVTSSLTNGDTNCPVFKAWKKCHFADKNSLLYKQAETKDKGGNGLFDKRFARYVTIQVLEDKNQPELVGKYMFWKVPKSVWEIIDAKMNPAKESGKSPIPVMDFLFGRAIELTVKPGPGSKTDTSYTRETSYIAELTEDVVSCTNPDGSSLLSYDQQRVLDTYVNEIKQIWRERDANRRAQMMQTLNANPNTAELRSIYSHVLEQIKGFCPDLNKELGYQPWSQEVTDRVNRWIEVVLSGNNPSAKENEQAAAFTVEQAAPAQPTAQPTQHGGNVDVFTMPAQQPASFVDDNDDLPF
jgi:hypothetical protein